MTVDTGGTKTLIASFDEQGVLGETIRFPTPHAPKDYLDLLTKTLHEHYDNADIDALVIALPGRIDTDQVLVLARNLEWRDFDVKRALEDEFDCPILIENDANLAGLAAARALEQPVHTCLYITVSTGIGTGLIVNSRIDSDYKQSEGGRMVLEYDGALMHWEDFASGRAIRDEYGAYASEIDDPMIWKEIARKLSRGLLVITPLLRPDIIVIGGSIGTYFDLYRDALLQHLHDHLHYVPPIQAANQPEQAVLYGCYYYALDYFATR